MDSPLLPKRAPPLSPKAPQMSKATAPSPGDPPKSSIWPAENIIEGSAGQGREATQSKALVCLASQADTASCAPAFSHANYSVYPAACLLRRPALPGSERTQRKGGDSQPGELHS